VGSSQRRSACTHHPFDSFPSHGEFYTLWDFFLPSFRCPHRVDRVGVKGDGGKWVCGLERIIPKKKCVITRTLQLNPPVLASVRWRFLAGTSTRRAGHEAL
ncbi:hypothetical protein EV363DRAFT_293923, partial [Boletus edulis]